MPETEEKDTEFISQDDIDALLSHSEEEEIEEDYTAAEEMLGNTDTEGEASGDGDALPPDPDQDSEPDLTAEPDSEPGIDTELDSEPDLTAETDSEPDREVLIAEDEVDQFIDDADIEEENEAEEISDRVILEDVPGEADDPEPEKSRWGVKRLLLIASPVILFVCFVLGYVLFSYLRKPAELNNPTVQSFSIAPKETLKEAETAKVKIEKEAANSNQPVSVAGDRVVVLKRFLVPAPTQRKDMTYVTADLSIELATSTATRLIKDHSAFYRNIIYDVLKQALTSMDKSKISEISLKIAILKALNSALPERSIKDVTVDAFIMY